MANQREGTGVAGGSERKISETILDFASPLLEAINPAPTLEQARRAVGLAIHVWNLSAMASPPWGHPELLEDARRTMSTDSPALAAVFEQMVERRRRLFADDLRVVGNWTLTQKSEGGFSLRCDGRLPTHAGAPK